MPNVPVLAVSACLFRRGDALLIRRANAPFADRWSLPGGKLHNGETLQAAAQRELYEETGILAAALHFVTLNEVIQPESHYVIAIYAGDSEAVPVAASDAAEARYFSATEIEHLVDSGQTTPGLGKFVTMAREIWLRQCNRLATSTSQRQI